MKVSRPDRATRKANTSLRRKFSEKRTVYYHEEFDSESSSEDERPLTSRKKTPKKKDNSKKRKSTDDSKVIIMLYIELIVCNRININLLILTAKNKKRTKNIYF